MKSIFITGTSSGIGAATAALFLNKGWRVFGSVRKRDDAAVLERSSENFVPIIMDITHESEVVNAVNEIGECLDGAPLDILCNNAGTSVPAATIYQSVAGFRDAIELNLIAPFFVARTCFPLLRKPGGRIVFVGSLAGVDALPFCGAYSAAKHGIEGLAGSLRVELTSLGVKTIVIAPGSVRTAIGSKIGSETPIEGAESEFAPAFGRMAAHMAD